MKPKPPTSPSDAPKDAWAHFRRLGEKITETTAKNGFPMPTPGRGKRLPTWADSDQGRQAFTAAIAGMDSDMAPVFREFMISVEELEDMLVDAVLSGDHATLFHVAEAVKAAREHEHQTRFTRHVAAALEAKRELFLETGRNPLKGDIRKRAETLLEKNGVIPYSATSDWTAVYAAAKLSELEQKWEPRGKGKVRKIR